MGFWRAREVFAMMEVRWTRTLRSWFLLRVEQANLCPWHDKTIELWFQTRDKTENGPFGNELRVVKSIFDAEWYNQSVFTTVFSFCIVGTYVISSGAARFERSENRASSSERSEDERSERSHSKTSIRFFWCKKFHKFYQNLCIRDS